jgi:hypothetical protein
MDTPHSIASLRIVGYANRLTPETVPSVVPPLFQVATDQDIFLLPPFVIHNGFVCDASEKTAAEISALNHSEEVTLFKRAFAAQADFELWIDEKGKARYEPISEAEGHLQEIAETHIQLARSALKKGDYEQAEDDCRIALCADDSQIEPLAINAAIARKKHDAGEEQLMEEFAKGRITPSGFKSLVDRFLEGTPEESASDAGEARVCQPMHHVAQRKALV